ncbi:MAG: rhamnulokinase [Kouleothrix sp.]|nr:rhamnulokinase [Kouleothrix sp.]
MTGSHYLAIDLGAESGRAMLGQLDGGRLALSELHRFPNTPVRLPGGLHWDVLRLWAEIKNGLRLAAQQHGHGLASVGLDTWGVDFALLDRDGALIANPHHYRDSRTDGMLAEALRRLPREQIFERTGIQFIQINTLFQLLAMAAGRSPALEIAETFLTIPDLLNFWLTGQRVCEFTNATTTQCYDPRAGDWATPVLDAIGIPRRIFPPVVMPGTLLGALQPEVAEETGAHDLPVVAPACHDTGSAVAAVPAEAPGFAWLSSGTWSIMGFESPEPVITAQSLAFNLTNEGGVGGTFRCSKNIMGLWLVQECRRTWAAQGHDWSYGDLAQLAAEAAPLVALVDPDAEEFFKPGDMPERIRAFCRRTGQPAPEGPGAVVRCVLESMALKYRWVLDRLETVAGRRLDPIHIIGGGAQNRLLNQLTADATGRSVIAGPVEATAIGNILVQAIALGQLGSLAEARAVVRRSFELDRYQPAAAADWDAAYQRLLDLTA